MRDREFLYEIGVEVKRKGVDVPKMRHGWRVIGRNLLLVRNHASSNEFASGDGSSREWIYVGVLLALAVLDGHVIAERLKLERPSEESPVWTLEAEEPLES